MSRSRLTCALVATFALLAIASVEPALAAGSTFTDTPIGTWTVNGPVRAFAQEGNILWIGGQFTQLSDKQATKPGAQVIPVSNLAAIDVNTGTPIAGLHMPMVTGGSNAIVYALTVADGQLFIGGVFTAVDGTARQNMASVDPDTGALNGFKEKIGPVWTMTADATKLYVGGGFTKVGTLSRDRLAAFGFDGTLDPSWNPQVDNVVRDLSLSPDGGSIYVVGEFKNAASPGGAFQTRNSAAKFDTDAGILDAWQMGPPLSTMLYGIGVEAIGDRVYVGMGGSDWAAAFNDTDGTQLWKTDTYGQVQDIAVLGNQLIIGGHFSWVAPEAGHGFICTSTGGNGCIARSKMAALDLNGTLDQSWDPDMSGAYPGVWRVHVNGNDLWAGGAFKGVSGSAQQRLALFNDLSGSSSLFSDGFESGYVSAWNEGDNGLTVEQGNTNSGQYAAEADTTGPSKYAEQVVAPAPPEVWYTIHFDVLSRSSAATLGSIRQTGGTEMYRVFLAASGKLAVLDGVSHKTLTSTTAPSSGWHTLQVHLLSGASGTADVQLDGTAVPALTVSEAFGAPGRFQLGDTVANRVYDILYDDVDVSTAP